MLLDLKSHKPGSSITIINTIVDRYRDDNDGKYKERLTLVYKDTKTGLKYKEEIQDPLYEYYTIRPEYRRGTPVMYEQINHCEMHRVKRLGLERDIAKNLGLKKWYEDKIRENDRKAIRDIHKHPAVLLSDNNIEDHYRFWFANTFENEICSISKAFFDIEVDGIEIAGQFPEPGECPVNAITVVFQDRMETYTFLLRNPANPQIAEFETYLKNGGVEDLRAFLLNHVSENNINKSGQRFFFGLENMKFNIVFYDDEMLLIRDFFRAINTFKPDFALAWNQSFDIPYLIARCERLGYDPKEIICHPDFDKKRCFYFIDERNKNEFEERCDYFDCSSYTVYLDQMIQYASRRKGQTKSLSYSLDFIGELVAHVRKLDYKGITQQIEELPYKDYKTFVFYNICDTMVQYCIEYFTQDVEYVFGKVIMNNTRYSKIHRQTIYLTNRGQQVLWERGFVKGNNVNLDNPKNDYPGAFVADPLQVNDYSRLRINGHVTNMFENLYDSDFKALYPSIMRQFNVFPHTQIGFIMMANNIHNKQNRTHYQYYTAGGQFLENLQTHNWLDFGERWFGLMGFSDLVKYTRKLFTTELKPMFPMHIEPEKDENGFYNPFITYGQYYFPLCEINNPRTGMYCPFDVSMPIPEETKQRMKEWKEYVAVTPNQSF